MEELDENTSIRCARLTFVINKLRAALRERAPGPAGAAVHEEERASPRVGRISPPGGATFEDDGRVYEEGQVEEVHVGGGGGGAGEIDQSPRPSLYIPMAFVPDQQDRSSGLTVLNRNFHAFMDKY